MDGAAFERLRDYLGAEGENMGELTRVLASLPGDEVFLQRLCSGVQSNPRSMPRGN